MHAWCTASVQGDILSIEHAQDSLVQAYAVVLTGMSDIGMAMIGNKKALFMTLVDRIPQFDHRGKMDWKRPYTVYITNCY